MARIPAKREVSTIASPPDKRRRKNIDDNLWDNDNTDDFTYDELQDIDHMIACSQMTSVGVVPDAQGRSRTVGRGTGRSQSMTDGRKTSHQKDNCLGNAHGSRQYLSSERLNTNYNRHVPVSKPLPSSPSMAASTGNEQNSQVLPSSNSTAGINGQNLKRSNCKCEDYKQELRKLKDGQYSKDGQIKMLRVSLAQRDAEMRREKMERLRVIEEAGKVQSAKEHNLTQELKRLQTQLQFKEQDIAEVQTLCKRLESKQAIATDTSDRAPQPTRSNLVRSPRTPKNAFPSTQSFFAEDKSPPAQVCTSSEVSTRGTTVRRSFRMALKCQKVMNGVRMVDKLLDTDRCSGLVRLLQSISLDRSPGVDPMTTHHRSTADDNPHTESCNKNSEVHEQLAMRAVSALLHQQVSAPDELLLLPLITAQLDAYIDHADRLRADHKMEDSQLVDTDYSRPALSALNLLYTLVQYSRNVCNVLVHGVSEVDGDSNTVDKESGQVRLARMQCGTREVVKCELFNNLIKLSNPLLCRDKSSGHEITKTTLLILARLAQTTNVASLQRFESLVSEDHLLACLTDQMKISRSVQFVLAFSALDILSSLVRSSHLLTMCCARTDDHLLQLISSVCLHEHKAWSQEQLTQLGLQVVTLLLTVVSHHRQGALLLLSNRCSCANEIVKSVVLLLHRVIQKCYDNSAHSVNAQINHTEGGRCKSQMQQNVLTEGECSKHKSEVNSTSCLLLLRKGFCLLHCLAAYDPPYTSLWHPVQHQYVQVVCTTERIFQQAGVSEHELVSLRELWDWDHEYSDLSNEEDDDPAPHTSNTTS